MEPLAIPLSNPKTVAKWLVIKIQSSPKYPTRGRRSATGKSSPCGIVSKARKRGKQARRVAAARKKFRAPLGNHLGQQLVPLPAVKYGKIAAAHLNPNQLFFR